MSKSKKKNNQSIFEEDSTRYDLSSTVARNMPKGSKVKFQIGKTGSNESLASNESVAISSNESVFNSECIDSLPDSPDMVRNKKTSLIRFVGIKCLS